MLQDCNFFFPVQAISSGSENGPVEGYCVLYGQLYSTRSKTEKCVPIGIRTAKLTGLLPWRYYEVTVVVYNHVGRSVESSPKSARTSAEGL